MSEDEDVEVERSERNRFGHVDARIIEDNLFTINGRFIYSAFACRAGSGRVGKVKRRTLADDLGISLDTLDRGIKEMRLAGIIETVQRYGSDGSRIANGYRLHDFLDLPKAVADRAQARADARRRDGDPTPSRTGAAGGASRTEAVGVAAPVRLGGPRGSGGASRAHAAARTREGLTREGLTKNQQPTPSSAAAPAAEALFEVPADPPPPEPEPQPETEGQRVNRLTHAYTDAVPLSNFPAVAGIVRKAVRAARDGAALYADDEITDALKVLADENRPVSTETLRIALEGLPPRPTAIRPARVDVNLARGMEISARLRARHAQRANPPSRALEQ